MNLRQLADELDREIENERGNIHLHTPTMAALETLLEKQLIWITDPDSGKPIHNSPDYDAGYENGIEDATSQLGGKVDRLNTRIGAYRDRVEKLLEEIDDDDDEEKKQ